MSPKGYTGVLISFEGIDSCGKTTQVSMVEDYLVSRSKKVVVLREPGGTELGERIRDILSDTRYANMADKAEALLFAASRAQLVQECIRPSLKLGMVVLLDRYFDSSLAYQGYARGLGMEEVRRINLWAVDGIIPDLTLLLDIDPEEACQRKMAMQDRIEMFGLELQRKVREGYIELLRADPERIKLIDASLPPEKVFLEIKKYVDAVVF